MRLRMWLERASQRVQQVISPAWGVPVVSVAIVVVLLAMAFGK